MVKKMKPISIPETRRYSSSSQSTSQFINLSPSIGSVGRNSTLNLFLKIKGFTLFIMNFFDLKKLISNNYFVYYKCIAREIPLANIRYIYL